MGDVLSGSSFPKRAHKQLGVDVYETPSATQRLGVPLAQWPQHVLEGVAVLTGDMMVSLLP